MFDARKYDNPIEQLGYLENKENQKLKYLLKKLIVPCCRTDLGNPSNFVKSFYNFDSELN